MEYPELADIIRMNKLVRGGIQSEEFEAWYARLTDAQRRTLTYMLVEFAFQAGVDAEVVGQAQRLAASSAHSTGVRLLLRTCETTFRSLHEFHAWLESAELDVLHDVFEFAVALFGVAEGRVYSNETEESCNHWWHRDLANPEVEADLLRDPEFFRTSMSTDRRIAGQHD